MRFCLLKHITRKPIVLLLSFLILASAGMLFHIGQRFFFTATEGVRLLNLEFTTVVQPDVDQIHVALQNTPTNERWRERYSMYRNLMLQIIDNPYTSVDDRRSYLGAVNGLVPMLSPHHYITYPEHEPFDLGEINQYSNMLYKMAVYDVTCVEVVENALEFHDMGYDAPAFREYVIKVNTGVAHHVEYGNYPAHLRVYDATTHNGQPIMEVGGRYLIAGEVLMDIEYDDYVTESGGFFEKTTVMSVFINQKLYEGENEEYRTAKEISDKLMLPVVRLDESATINLDSEDAFQTSTGLSKDLASHWYTFTNNINDVLSSLPVVTTNNLDSLPAFNTNATYIISGRAFTPADYAEGTKTGVISADLAESAGLSVGDTLYFRFREIDFTQFTGAEAANDSWAITCDPLAKNVFAEDTYTIIGIYQSPGWEVSGYNFTPNTVFIPAESMPLSPTEQEYALQVEEWNAFSLEQLGEPYVDVPSEVPAYLTGYTIPSNRLDAFMDSLDESTRPYILVLDQGYSHVAPIQKTIQRNAVVIFCGVAALWLIVVFLFLYAMITKGKHEIRILHSMGASRQFLAVFCLLLCLVPWIFSMGVGVMVADAMYNTVEEEIYTRTIDANLNDDRFSNTGSVSQEGVSADSILNKLRSNRDNFQVKLVTIAIQIATFWLITVGYVLISTRKKLLCFPRSE